MSKTLIVAEKPSVARDIAKALGVPNVNGVLENDEIVITNCIGHLVEIHTPLADDSGAPLPIIPDVFELRAIAKTRDQFKVVKSLMQRADIGKVANACDAGREGEAIFRLTYELAKCKKPMERLWLQSMTAGAIKAAWKERKPGSNYDHLADASRSRAEADWLVGINGSRALRKAVGRVMTPTLALVVNRYLEHKNFVPKPYFEVHGTFGLAAGEYKARWVNRGEKDENEDNRSRISDRAKAQALIDKCAGVAPSAVHDETKPTKSIAPLLFDLTTLQREANKRFNLSAKKTLDIAQALYEKHKATSYPRTDASALPEDYVGKAGKIVESLAGVKHYQPHAERITRNSWIRPNKRIFNDSKISDHFAIIPTGVIPTGLDADESKIYDLICRRFLAIFHPDAEFLSTARVTLVAGEEFRATGRVMTSPGWLEVWDSDSGDDDKTPSLPKLVAGEQAENRGIELKSLETKPPALFNEATLLAAMETAGKAIEDDELADAMKERGLGTPATRAATIEKLLSAGKNKTTGKPGEPYMQRKGKTLVPTEKGIQLVTHLQKKAPKLASPEMTGEWEFKLKQMEKGEVQRESFMTGIAQFTREMVAVLYDPNQARTGGGSQVGLQAPCPSCGGALSLGDTFCACAGCEFKLWRTIAGRRLSTEEMETLVKAQALPVMDGFVSSSKKPFQAGLKLDIKAMKVEFVFAPREDGPKADLGVPCPKCQKPLTLDARICACPSCDFKLWRTIAGRVLSAEEMSTLIKEKALPVMDGFVSSSKKPFQAGLKLDIKAMKVEFVFAPREDGPKTTLDEPCPKCKKPLVTDDRTCLCAGCGFKLWRNMAGRQITDGELKTLLREKQTPVLKGFKSKSGKTFSARLKLSEPYVGKVDFLFD